MKGHSGADSSAFLEINLRVSGQTVHRQLDHRIEFYELLPTLIIAYYFLGELGPCEVGQFMPERAEKMLKGRRAGLAANSRIPILNHRGGNLVRLSNWTAFGPLSVRT